MLRAFEDNARINPRKLCLTTVLRNGQERSFSLHQVRLFASALAQVLRSLGVKHGHFVSVDLPNNEMWPFLLLAAAYGGFSLVAIDNSLSAGEKATRLMDLERMPNMAVSYHVSVENAAALLEKARVLIDGEHTPTALRPSASLGPMSKSARDSHTDMTKIHPSQLRRYTSDEEEAVVHFADHAVHLFDSSKAAIVMFTAGSTGPSKAVMLSWENLYAAALASNKVLGRQEKQVGNTVWQTLLPLSSIGGLQVFLRCLAAGLTLVLQERTEAKEAVSVAKRLGVTHVALSGAQLQELLKMSEPLSKFYRCVLLNENHPSNRLVADCVCREVPLFLSYGMTETTSLVAFERASAPQVRELLQTETKPHGYMKLLSGVEARIIDPDPEGFGKLALRGKTVFGGYLNAYASFSADGYFITNDTARLATGGIVLRGPLQDMFVCASEAVEPAKLRQKLMQISGVADAYVFPAPDAKCGRRPAAFIERKVVIGESSYSFTERVNRAIRTSVSKVYQPKYLFSLERFPRRITGEVDSDLLIKCFEERIEVQSVKLYIAQAPHSQEYRSACENAGAHALLREEHVLLVEVCDTEGRTGLGECVLPHYETPDAEKQLLEKLGQCITQFVFGKAFLHPGELGQALHHVHDYAHVQKELSALEISFWDLYGKITGKPLWGILGGTRINEAGASARMAAGAYVPNLGVRETVEAVWHCKEAGYRRIKVEIRPHTAFQRIRALRQVFPDSALAVRAGMSFTPSDIEELKALDTLGISWIEDPIAPNEGESKQSFFARLSELQKQFRMPICVCNSIESLSDAYEVLKHHNLRCIALDVNKLGGIRHTLDFVRRASKAGVYVWMDGSNAFGLIRRVCAAFQTLSIVTDAGDIGSVCRRREPDLFVPLYAAERGVVSINRNAYGFGIGCELDRTSLEPLLCCSKVLRAE